MKKFLGLAFLLIILIIFNLKVTHFFIPKIETKINNLVDTSLYHSNFNSKLYNFLINKDNRIKVYNSAVNLNNNASSNSCVFFISEVLRENNYSISEDTANTETLIEKLSKKSWKKELDYRKMKPGDICFTTDEKGRKNGIPSHTYIFMNWVTEGKYDFAMVCDNQAKDYGNLIYHKRNINFKYSLNGKEKDGFSFFMYML
ncbi:MAG TPA: hypothetical protein VIK72_11685 [Clostridiaceae bacterium]